MKARGKTWRLHLGMSILAELQEQHGEALEAALSPQQGKLPNLRMMHEIFLAALRRHHSAEIDKPIDGGTGTAGRWIVDDIISENLDAFGKLLTAAFPAPGAEETPAAPGKIQAAA